MVKNITIAALAVLVLVFGGLYLKKPAVVEYVPQSNGKVVEVPVGASSGTEHYNLENFYNGLTASKFYGLYSVNASSSTTTMATITLALGAGSQGEITIGTSTPVTNVVYASTTAVTLNSMVFLQQIATTTIPGVTCNTTVTTTPITKIFVSPTTTLSGFSATAAANPVTNPLCYAYWILDKSK